jgi:hypothetical protein
MECIMCNETGLAVSRECEEVCCAIRMGLFDEAEALLVNVHCAEAVRLNLLGAICERRHQWREAARNYGRALRADHEFRAAEDNLRRIYELNVLGHSDQRMMLGDERPALAALLRARDEAVHRHTLGGL